MPLPDSPEHFCTLFDVNFIAQGLCLYESLCRQAAPFHLSIICMDQEVEKCLRQLSLANITVIPLREAENERLLSVKAGRTRGEYCWTWTSFTFDEVFKRFPDAKQVTYLDADLYFFDSPGILLNELKESGKDVLITDHAYAPEYRVASRFGRFNVQFITMKRSTGAEAVRRWWQDRCIEWCFCRYENGKFGDQLYLDQFPVLFESNVHILIQTHLTLAPWNVRHFMEDQGKSGNPVFYHFQGLRRVSETRFRTQIGFNVGHSAQRFYSDYLDAIKRANARLKEFGLPDSRGIYKPSFRERLRVLKYTLLNRISYAQYQD